MKNSKIRTFYHPNMSMNPDNLIGYTHTPAKPRLIMEYLRKKGLLEYFLIDDKFPPFSKEDFYIAARLIRYGLVDVSPLIQGRYPLEKLSAALDQSITPGCYRIIVQP